MSPSDVCLPLYLCLSVGNTGGTYADMTIHPISENTIREVLTKNTNDNQSNEIAHTVVSRTYVNIMKI